MNNEKRIELLNGLLDHTLEARPLPWICELDQVFEVKTCDGTVIARFGFLADAENLIALAEERQRVLGFFHAASERVEI